MISITRWVAPFIFSNLLFHFAAVAAANDFKCFKGDIKTPYAEGPAKVETTDFCTNDDRNELRSKGCLKLECLPKNKLSKIKLTDIYGDSGTPGFKLCRAMGGKATLISFKLDGKWHPLDRCLLGTQFVNVGALVDAVGDSLH